MAECVFCKIVAKELPAEIIQEDQDHLAFLDIKPQRKGQTVVIPKKHPGAYVFDMPDEDLAKLFLFTKKVAKVLDQALGTIRTVQVTEGLGVDHVHVKLYPLVSLDKEGALVHMGKLAQPGELKETADKIRKEG